MEIQLYNIESVEQLEDFQDEYVYDIEVDDTHTFFANDILAHNSIYVEFGRLCNYLNILDNDKATRLVVDMWNYGCGPYMDQCYEDYAKQYNCDSNIQALELEKIADTAVMVAKKRYAMSECFLEPNIYVTPGEHVLYKGLELVQGSTAPFARKCQDDFFKYVLDWYAHHNTTPPFDDIYDRMKKYKDEFLMQAPEQICKASSISDYNKSIVDDNKQLVIGDKCPIHVKAAGTYNYFLNMDKNKQYKTKYNKIKTRDKVKFYKTTNPDFPVFGYLPNKFPLEFALPMDYDQQFDDLILKPLNKILDIFNYSPITPDLCFTTALF